MNDQIGAAWVGTGQYGQYISGKLKVLNEDWNFFFSQNTTKDGRPYYSVRFSNDADINMSFNVFQNNHKVSSKHPDYIILRKEQRDRTDVEVEHNGNDEIPF